jgi:hypothetical protein
VTGTAPAPLYMDAAVRRWQSCTRRHAIRESASPQVHEQQVSKTWCLSKGRNGVRHTFEFLATLKRAFDGFQRALRAPSEPARIFFEYCRARIMALAKAPEPSIAAAPSGAGDAAVTAAPTGACVDGGYHGIG